MSERTVFFDGVELDAADRGRGPYVWRFTPFQRVLHAVLLVTFYVLAFTGLPLRFGCVPWAGGLMRLWGGASMAGLIHRWAAGALLACVVAFPVVYLVRAARAGNWLDAVRGPRSIVLQASDFREFWAMLRWALGRGPKPPLGRYTYRERFSWAVTALGIGVIALSGLLLWFPEWFGRFLPGIVFNVATVVHSYNAMLLAALIVTYHFVDVHLRPNKFPLDGVMFTGRATFGYMQEEHPALAQELGDPTRLESSARAVIDRVAPPPPRWMHLLGSSLGLLALALGAVLVGLGLWDALC